MSRAFAFLTIQLLLAATCCLRAADASPQPPPASFDPYVGSIDVSEDGAHAIRLTRQGLELWDARGARRVSLIADATRGWLSNDGTVVVTASEKGGTLQVRQWNGRVLCTIPGSSGSVVAVGGGRILTRRAAQTTVRSQGGMTLGYKAILEARDLRGRRLWSRSATLSIVAGERAAVSRNGERALVDLDEGRLHLIDMARGASIWTGAPNTALVSAPLLWKTRGLAWLADGRLHVADGPQEKTTLLKVPARATIDWISMDGRRAIVLKMDGTVEIADTESGAVVARTRAPAPLAACRLDGDTLVMVTRQLKERRTRL